jgi:hypothetical protein
MRGDLAVRSTIGKLWPEGGLAAETMGHGG